MITPSDVARRLRVAGCVYAEDEARLLTAAARTNDDLTAMVARRVAGEPIEYIVGWAQFCGLRLYLEAGVFVPRHRTELLAREAAALARKAPGYAVVVDLCCGCGAIGAVVAHSVPGIELHATDIDPAAVRSARRNLTDAAVYQGDLFDPLSTSLLGRVDVLVANTPYVPTDEIRLMPAEARLHEARQALDGGADGLDLQRRVAAGAARWLTPDGYVLMETSEWQAAGVAAAMTLGSLTPRTVHSDEMDATIVVGRAGGQ